MMTAPSAGTVSTTRTSAPNRRPERIADRTLAATSSAEPSAGTILFEGRDITHAIRLAHEI